MILITKKYFLFIFLVFSSAPSVNADLLANNDSGLLWLTEEYPPYNYHDAEGNLKGISVEILLAVMASMNIKFTTEDILVLPWARAYKEAQKKPNTALFTMNLTEERKKHFKFVGPISPSKISVFTTSPSLTIRNIDDLSRLNVGVVRNDVGEQLLDVIGLKPEAKIKLPTSLETIRMLLLKRVDAIALEENIARFEFNRLGVDKAHYYIPFTIKESTTHFAFNKKVPEQFIQKFERAFFKLKETGQIEKIRSKYDFTSANIN